MQSFHPIWHHNNEGDLYWMGMAAAFDGRPKSRGPVRLTFKSVTEQDGIVWMRYLVDRHS